MSLQTYDPSEVTLILGAIYEVTSFSEDSLINLKKDEKFYETSVGALGTTERTHVPNQVYTLTISLSQTSPSNKILNLLSQVDNLTQNGIFPIFAKDSSGTSVFLCGLCRIEKPPEAKYEKGIVSREWQIRCTNVSFAIGGNTDVDTWDSINYISSLTKQLGLG